MIHHQRWTLEKITRRLPLIQPLVYRKRLSLDSFRYQELDGPLAEPIIDPNADDGAWPVIEGGAYWGSSREDFVLRTTFQVPEDWNEADGPISLLFVLGHAQDFLHPEALVYIDGEPYAACDRYHDEVLLPERWRDGRPHTLALHGYAGAWPEVYGQYAQTRLLMGNNSVVQIDPPTRAFVAAARNAMGAAADLAETDPAHARLLNALNNAFTLLDTREPLGGDAFYASVPHALEVLQAEIAASGAPLPVQVVGTGHAHIDVAWLWTLGQTRRKAGRTFYNVLRLMEQFPNYHFTQSQPQLYDYVKNDYPELFEEIRTRVDDGRWELIGGMWVEADCNLSGGESLARQFILGRAFFDEHYGPGKMSPVLWLPDVFGYAWNLPQLIKLAGLEYFFTIKIGWNQFNHLPYDTFWWQGLDGTRVLTSFSTTPEPGHIHNRATYNAEITPRSTLGTWLNFQQKEREQPLLMSFGYGDGGGGPTREMLENMEVLGEFPALPKLRSGSVIDYFRELETASPQPFPVWNGELYLELHRGTYTTQGRNKRANRKSEFLLHDAEFLAAWAALLPAGAEYPRQALRRAWELVCLNQFHDIIPGSSIGPVYVESLAQYDEIETLGSIAKAEALNVLLEQVGGDVVIINPTGFARSEVAFWPGEMREGFRLERADDGTVVFLQPTREEDQLGVWLGFQGALPPYSITPLRWVEGEQPMVKSALQASTDVLENLWLRVEINSAGDITRIYDKQREREVLPPGQIANQFQAFEDRPLHWDAWDIDIFYDDRLTLSEPAESIRLVEVGPARAIIEIRRRILNSIYVQTIAMSSNSPQIDFDTSIDWREKHTLLKVAFPADLLSPAATYEIQWGNVQRPTHRNTSWDWARFETCAQKWVDLSEGDYGVSLLNDCKYGHDLHGQVLRLSLLRSPTNPDPNADQGEHTFRYSLRVHDGPLGQETIAAAYALNDPLIVVEGENSPVQPLPPLVTTDSGNIVLETVKQSEDGSALVVRFYECLRQRRPVTLKFGFEVAAAEVVNLHEETMSPATVDGNTITLMVRPFEIVTVKVTPRSV